MPHICIIGEKYLCEIEGLLSNISGNEVSANKTLPIKIETGEKIPIPCTCDECVKLTFSLLFVLEDTF